MNSDTGLTTEEQRVMDHLVAAWCEYANLPVQHSSEPDVFCEAIHRCQDQLAVRICRRAYPQGWPMRQYRVTKHEEVK